MRNIWKCNLTKVEHRRKKLLIVTLSTNLDQGNGIIVLSSLLIKNYDQTVSWQNILHIACWLTAIESSCGFVFILAILPSISKGAASNS